MPSTLGLATIHDKDILIYCISQLIAKMKTGAAPGRTLHIKAHDLLVSTNRNIDGGVRATDRRPRASAWDPDPKLAECNGSGLLFAQE